MSPKFNDYLRRLPVEHYLGHACVHWSLTIQNRQTGWLTPLFYYKFRELLTHAMFRYGIACPIYCCMPDHLHMMWAGLFSGSNQLNAMKYFRRQLNAILKKIGHSLQSQCYDNVLSEEQLEHAAFESACEYIARNPERQGLVTQDDFRNYKFTDCLIPGAPEVHFTDEQFWDTYGRIRSSIERNGLIKTEHGIAGEEGLKP